jgi:hypothetical protein
MKSSRSSVSRTSAQAKAVIKTWSILAGWKHQGSINRDNIIDKRNAGTQANPCRGGFKRKLGEIFLNLITNPWTGGELSALFCGYIKNGP